MSGQVPDNGDGGGSGIGGKVLGWVIFIAVLLLLNFVIFPFFNIPLYVY